MGVTAAGLLLSACVWYAGRSYLSAVIAMSSPRREVTAAQGAAWSALTVAGMVSGNALAKTGAPPLGGGRLLGRDRVGGGSRGAVCGARRPE